MESYLGYIVACLLTISAILLGTLVPGGPIENRNFSHIPPFILGIFNVFLTILGMGSFALIYFTIQGYETALILAVVCGISYFLVYALDLGKIFPVSPDRMPRALFWIEVIGLILSIPLMFFSYIYLSMPDSSNNIADIQLSDTTIMALIAVIALGVGIVIFSTKSAMRKFPEKTNSIGDNNN